MLEELKKQVYEANLELVKQKVVIYTWGNVSGIDRDKGLVVIKPSGIPYEDMTAEDMVVVDAETGGTVEGKWKPSSDTATHLELYRACPSIGGVTHTHSVNAVAFAQAGMDIPSLGTTHADYFYGDIPCTRYLTKEEAETDYETHTGQVILETIRERKQDIEAVPAILVRNHGPFAWGKDANDAVHNAVVMEQVAKMASIAFAANPHLTMNSLLIEKHFSRKHGPNAYYGQK